MRKVLVGVAVSTLIVGGMIGGTTLTVVVAAIAAGITGFLAWEIKTMQEKARENTRLLPQCEKNVRAISDGYKKAGVLLERIKKESVRGVWEDINARFMCIDPLYTNGMLSEARALMHDMPLWLPRTNTLLVALEKSTRNDLAILEGIMKLSAKIEYFEDEIVKLSSSIREHITAMEKIKSSLSATEAEQLASATKKLDELKRNLMEAREINHTAVFMQLKSLSGTMERLAAKHHATSSKENILPFKVGRTLA